MSREKFEFPHEKESKQAADADEQVEFSIEGDEGEAKVEVEVRDDTPTKDRNRKPMKAAPEEVTDEELAEYSDKVQSRLKHFSRGYHDERRAKEAALREREEAIRVAQKVMEENKAIAERLRVHEEEEIKRAKMTAHYRVRQAHEAGDSDKLALANEELAKAVMREERFAIKKQEDDAKDALQEAKQDVSSQSQDTRVAVDPRATQWREENEWFGSDDEMTSFALGLHQKLIKSGVDPRSDEYYDSINRRMRQVFPDQFDEAEPEEPKPEAKPKRASVVAAATRSTAPRKVVLTKSQVAIANRLGVPLELYAQKVAEGMRK